MLVFLHSDALKCGMWVTARSGAICYWHIPVISNRSHSRPVFPNECPTVDTLYPFISSLKKRVPVNLSVDPCFRWIRLSLFMVNPRFSRWFGHDLLHVHGNSSYLHSCAPLQTKRFTSQFTIISYTHGKKIYHGYLLAISLQYLLAKKWAKHFAFNHVKPFVCMYIVYI